GDDPNMSMKSANMDGPPPRLRDDHDWANAAIQCVGPPPRARGRRPRAAAVAVPHGTTPRVRGRVRPQRALSCSTSDHPPRVRERPADPADHVGRYGPPRECGDDYA